jgi:hypothetical protein
MAFKALGEESIPLSRANDHTIRDADGINATVPKTAMRIIVQVMAVLAAVEPVMYRRISMIGYPVSVPNAASMSPMQKRIASIKARPRVPLMATELNIQYGTATSGLGISSAR